MSPGEGTLAVIENPMAVRHSLQAERMRAARGKGDQDNPGSWLREIEAPHPVFHSVSTKMSTQRVIRVLAALCALGLLGGVVVGVLFIVKLLLRPTSAQSPTGLGDTKETSFCNVSEDTSVTDPRKGMCLGHATQCTALQTSLCENNTGPAGKQNCTDSPYE